MVGNEAVDQPLAGFGYDYWYICEGCGGRVSVGADLYELQSTRQAAPTVCASCGTAVDITEQWPTLRDTEDIALQSDSFDKLVWYHTSRYENWPDLEAYTADVTAAATHNPRRRSRFRNPQRHIAKKLSLAVHLGTYEAAIENMLRRLKNHGSESFFRTTYWLHRVEIALEPHDLYPEVVEEFRTTFGDVHLDQLDALGARAARYVNRYEARGSVSVAIDPAIIRTVSSIELPVAEAALPESVAAASAVARMMSIVQRDHNTDADWDAFSSMLQSEYLSGVNLPVRESLLSAVGDYDDPLRFHHRFRVLAGLLMRPDVVVDELASAPRRQMLLAE